MITTDTGAKKIEGTDNWRQIFGAHNDTVDAYDANIEALQDALGIVVDGNKSAVSASSGQFIILKNSSIVDSGDVMLADGLYTAAKAIPANTVIDKTYLTADANGGLNALNSKIVDIGIKTISGANMSTLNDLIVAYMNTMNNNEIRQLSIMATNGGSVLANSSWYGGFIFKNSNNYGTLLMTHHSGQVKLGAISGGGMIWSTVK